MSVTTLLAISLGAILTNNFIFSQFLGICPFLGVSKKIDTAVGMGAAVTFVMGLASAFCYLVNLVLAALLSAVTIENYVVENGRLTKLSPELIYLSKHLGELSRRMNENV